MAYTYLLYHIVISPKYHKAVINEEHERDLYNYILGVCRQKKCVLHRINSMPDHIHILVEVHPTISVADFVKAIKISTNTWMRNSGFFPDFECWAESYCALSYSREQKDTVRAYIMNQKEHHRHYTLAEEYTMLLAEFEMAPDEWLLKG